MHSGYASYGGIELWNASRLRAYAGPVCKWLGACSPCETLDKWLPSGELDDGIPGTNLNIAMDWSTNPPTAKPKPVGYPLPYSNPKDDPAPWVKEGGAVLPAALPDLYGFYGMTLLSATGVDSTSRTVDMTSSVQYGAVLGKVRRPPREMVFTLLAVGGDRAAVQIALETLAVTPPKTGPDFDPSGCGGYDFHWYTACPCMCADPDLSDPANAAACISECTEFYMRHLRGCLITRGPDLLEWLDVSCCAAATVELVITAGDPRYRDKNSTLIGRSATTVGV